MKKGILLLAIGHPNYGKMAAALAATIKASGSVIPIHLAYTKSAITHLTNDERLFFCSESEVPESYYKPANIRSKIFMYDISPFEETLYLDADIAWFKKNTDELFYSFKDIKLTFSNFGVAEGKESVWADLNEVRKAYDLGDKKLYHVHSEFVFFRKCKEVREYFKIVKKIYDNLKVKSTVFAGAIPDELPFAIASAKLELYPHLDNYRPIYWYNRDVKGKQLHELYDDFYGMSMAGNSNNTNAVEMYNILTKSAYFLTKLRFPYQWKGKRTFLPERSVL